MKNDGGDPAESMAIRAGASTALIRYVDPATHLVVWIDVASSAGHSPPAGPAAPSDRATVQTRESDGADPGR